MQSESSLISSSTISIVIPAYKQEKTIKKDIKRIEKSIQTLTDRYEIIVVIDGMEDGTFTQAKKFSSEKVKILTFEKNQGKGQAVRFGMLHAKGDVIGFIDAGMDINPNGFAMLLSHMEWYNADIIIGSKLHPVSKVDYPTWRRILSFGYRFMTRLLFGFKVRDTQVGLKFFKRQVVQDVLPRLLVKRYAFDIEILAVSYMLGYKRIFEAPVEIEFKNNSIKKSNIWKIIYHMLWDTCAVFYRLRILHYYSHTQKNRFSLQK